MTDAESAPAEIADGPYDIYLAYSATDEAVAQALQGELERLRPGIRVWREKGRINAGDTFHQAADVAIASSAMILAVWTPHALRTGAFTLETRRALNLRKPLVNLMAGTQPHLLGSPYSKHASFDLSEIVKLAGRSTGWLPPMRPSREEIDSSLRPLSNKIGELLQASQVSGAQVADAMIQNLKTTAGQPHTVEFEATLRALSPGDPATAIEVLLQRDYTEGEINTLISPQKVKVATREGGPQPWGAWLLQPQIRKTVPAHKDNGLLYAAAGFVAAVLAGGSLLLLGNALGGDAAVNTAATGNNGSGSSIARPASAGLASCDVTSSGTISNAPCRLQTNLALPQASGAADAGLADCRFDDNGALTEAPCKVSDRAALLPPPRGARPTGTDIAPLDACVPGPDGAISATPCRLDAPIEAAEPNLPPTCEVSEDGSVSTAPCLLSQALTAQAPQIVEVPGERVVETEQLDPCAVPSPGGEIAPGCRLAQTVRLAPRTCNENYTNLPCVLNEEPRRITAAQDNPATGGPDTSLPPEETTRPVRATPPANLDPVRVPENLEPCEQAIRAPCRLTVSKTGLNTLTEIAEVFYGNRNAWCQIYRANQSTFGGRNEPRRGSDPNCIFLSDVLDLPEPNDSNRYSTAGCPPAQSRNQCGPPMQ